MQYYTSKAHLKLTFVELLFDFLKNKAAICLAFTQASVNSPQCTNAEIGRQRIANSEFEAMPVGFVLGSFAKKRIRGINVLLKSTPVVLYSKN